MRPQSVLTLLFTVYFAIAGVAAVFQAPLQSSNHGSLAYLVEEYSSFLGAVPIPPQRPAPSLAPPNPAALLPLVLRRDPKKSGSSQGDSTTSEDTSQPTSSASDPAATDAASTITVFPTPASSLSTSSSPSASSPPTSSTSLIATTSSSLPASTTTSLVPSTTPAATSTPSKPSVSTALIAGVVIAILLVLAALTWVISMRRHLQQREWQFKYHERIFDGPEGLLGKKQQAQQQKEEVHEMTSPTPIKSQGATRVATEKELPARPEGNIERPERVLYGKEVKRKPVGNRTPGFG